MDPDVALWLRVGHVLGVFLWIGGLFTVYWLLRFHAHAPKEVYEKLTLIERAVALSMDLAAALAIGCGIGLIFSTEPNAFTRPGGGWFHIKLLVVVVGVLSVHGMLRAKIKKFGMGQVASVPQWIWSLLLVSITVISILVFRGPLMFAKKADTTAPAAPGGSAAPAPTPTK